MKRERRVLPWPKVTCAVCGHPTMKKVGGYMRVEMKDKIGRAAVHLACADRALLAGDELMTVLDAVARLRGYP